MTDPGLRERIAALTGPSLTCPYCLRLYGDSNRVKCPYHLLREAAATLARVEGLVAQWDKQADQTAKYRGVMFGATISKGLAGVQYRCADELRRALRSSAASRPPQEEPQDGKET